MYPLVVHCKQAEHDVYIGRPSKYGNPFIVGVHGTRKQCCDKYALWINGQLEAPNGEYPPTKSEIRKDLRRKRLGCWCAPKQCHGEYLALIANESMAGLFSSP